MYAIIGGLEAVSRSEADLSSDFVLMGAMLSDIEQAAEKDGRGYKLDGVDEGIIRALSWDPQITNKAIAQKLRISESTVAQRIRAMSDANVMRIVAQRDVFAGGYSFMCFADLDVSGDVKAVANCISACEDVISISQCLGSPQMFVNVRARDRHHLNSVLYEQIGGVSGVERIRSNTCLRIQKFTSEYGDLSSSLHPSAFDVGEGKDASIAKMLLEDGRVSNREIARRLDISEGSVRQRLKKMYDAKELRVGVVRNPYRLAVSAVAMIRIATQPRQSQKIADALSALTETSFVGRVTGEFDLWALVQAQDQAGIAKICDDFLAGFEGVLQVRVVPIVTNFVHRYDLVRIK